MLTESTGLNTYAKAAAASTSPPLRGYLGADAALAKDDVWAVGAYDYSEGEYHTLVEHWNVKAWSIIPTPNVGHGASALFAVAALSPTDAWAVGGYYLGNTTFNTLQFENESHTLVEHRDGKVWSVVSSPDPAATGGDAAINVLSALTVVSPNDIWAVGAYAYPSTPMRTLAIHLNGTVWSVVPTPNPNGNLDNLLYGVAAESPSSIWAVGTPMNTGGKIPGHCYALGWRGVEGSTR
jgi:hypothetical protein